MGLIEKINSFISSCEILNILYYTIMLYLVFKLVIFVYKNFFRKRVDLCHRYGKGSWALITGSTDGIGKEFAVQLAREGFNIILVSREEEKLNKTALELENLNKNVQTYKINFDFNKRNGLKDYVDVFGPVQKKFDVGILVNNVGTDYHISWKEFTIDQVHELVNLNVMTQAMLCKIFFEAMDNRKNRSAIINLSSFCSDFPFPMKVMYSSTKIFDHYLTTALREEHRGNCNIDFLSSKPLGVATPLTGKPSDGISILPTDVVVSATLDDLVHEDETYGHWLHKIQAFLINSVPGFILYPFLRRFWYTLVMNTNKKIR
jgi:17beta-estradiol 17-dehydrogenase / very-long-chain 3-oxoacyl-CoA reductase